jgi:asparagine synthase (glutamine-hydrolysing)
MFRYIACSWNVTDLQQSLAVERLRERLKADSREWQNAMNHCGLSVFYRGEDCRPTQTYLLQDNQGVVLGTLFNRRNRGPSEPQSKLFDAAATERIVSSQGLDLICNYWGNYVAVLKDIEMAGIRVIRGPSSSLPCLHVKHHQTDVFLSHAEDAVRLRLSKFSIDWQHVALGMIVPVPTNRTAIHEITQLLPGECVSIIRGKFSKKPYWDPFEIARSNTIENIEEAATALRMTVEECIHAWRTNHRRLILSLSGGLDSSIVLACLNSAPTRPDITCVTEYSAGSNSDERHYARLAANLAPRCTLIERKRDPQIALEGLLDSTYTASPQSCFRRVETSPVWRQLSEDCCASAIFTGTGGDQLFCQQGAKLGVADFIHRHGIRRSLARIAYDAAQLEGDTIWRVLLQAFYLSRISYKDDLFDNGLKSQTLISNSMAQSLRAMYGSSHILNGSRKLSAAPGTYSHVDGLSVLDDYYNPLGKEGDTPEIAPLFSQPIMEITLRMPTYVLMTNGRDRGLAREAFKNALPEEIYRRRSKGGIEEHVLDILLRNLAFVRELLSDGLLVQHGILDRAKVINSLANRPSNAAKSISEFAHLLNAEIWARNWAKEAPHIAA